MDVPNLLQKSSAIGSDMFNTDIATFNGWPKLGTCKRVVIVSFPSKDVEV
jgi:hypothetical protein